MPFKMAILPPEAQEEWPVKIREAVPGAEVRVFRTAEEAEAYIEDADCAYGFVPPELFSAKEAALDPVQRGEPQTVVLARGPPQERRHGHELPWNLQRARRRTRACLRPRPLPEGCPSTPVCSRRASGGRQWPPPTSRRPAPS